MLTLGFLITGIFLLTMQTTLLHLLPGWIGQPDLLFLLLIYIALRFDIGRGAGFAFFLGWNADIVSGVFLGLHPLAFTLLFAAIKWLQRHLALDEAHHLPALTAISYFVASSAIYVGANLLAPEAELAWPWGHVMLQMVILAIIVVPGFTVFNWIYRLATTPFRWPALGKKQANRFKN